MLKRLSTKYIVYNDQVVTPDSSQTRRANTDLKRGKQLIAKQPDDLDALVNSHAVGHAEEDGVMDAEQRHQYQCTSGPSPETEKRLELYRAKDDIASRFLLSREDDDSWDYRSGL